MEGAEPGSRVGEVIAGKYHLERLLGSGGMGAVYAAEHAFTQRKVAVKLMHPAIARSRVAAERFIREARAPGTIGHPGIVEVLDGGQAEDGSLYLVMEVLQGETLAAAMRARRLHLQEISAIVLELLDILASAHEAGFVHRDIKPDNVFLSVTEGEEDVEVKLLDFGVAGVLDESAALARADAKLTRAGAVLGTPLYMSPEQALGRAVDARADLWSVGALLYQALSGMPPYRGESFHQLIVSISTLDHTPLGMLRPDLPPRVHAVIERALRKDPQKRWASAHEMADALQSAVEGRSTAHSVDALGTASMDTQGSAAWSPPQSSPSRAASEHATPQRVMLVGMAIVAVLGAIVGVLTLSPFARRAGGGSQDALQDAVSDDALAHAQGVETLSPEPQAAVLAVATPTPTPTSPPTFPPTQASTAPVAPVLPIAVEPQPSAAALAPDPTSPPVVQPAQGLAQEALTTVLAAAQTPLQRCYEQAMIDALTAGEEALPSLGLEVSLRVAPAGHVHSAEVKAVSGPASASITDCVQRTLQAQRFPAAAGESHARFPIVFQSAMVGP